MTPQRTIWQRARAACAGLATLMCLGAAQGPAAGGPLVPSELHLKLGGTAALTLPDCPALLDWLVRQAPASPGATAPVCQRLRGAAATFRLRWSSVDEQVMRTWLESQHQAGVLEWFELVRGTLGLQSARNPLVARSPLRPVEPDAADPDFVDADILRMRQLLRIYVPAKPVVVAVIDSGVNADADLLRPLAWVNAAERAGNGLDDDGNGYVDDVRGWDFVDDAAAGAPGDDTTMPDNDPSDHLGHGSSVAAVLAATVGAQAPVALRIMALRVASGTRGSGTASPFALAEAVHYAVDNGAALINISVGSTQRFAVVAEAIQRALERGVVVVAAAGNTGAAVMFPANMPGVLAVGAADEQGRPWPGSAQGPQVAVFLRGTRMQTTVSGAWPDLSPNGTSFAAPLGSGLAAMLLAVATPAAGQSACAGALMALRNDRPPRQSATEWVDQLVERFEDDVGALHDWHTRWQAGAAVCGFRVNVATLLRQGGSAAR